MKRERSKNNTLMQSGVDAGLEIPIAQVNLPNPRDLVSELFEKEEISRMQIKDITANGGMSYLEIQHILATKPFLNDEDRKAFQESHQSFQPNIEQPQSRLSGHTSPFEELINKVTALLAACFGLEGDKKGNDWLRTTLFKK